MWADGRKRRENLGNTILRKTKRFMSSERSGVLSQPATQGQTSEPSIPEKADYSYVDAHARIAFYDDLLSAPRITEVGPASTPDYIEDLTTSVYDQAHKAGGTIPYTIIKEVSENFIHACFKEIVVSIFDDGNTIRFSDQGPGFADKEKAKLPGFSSATESMKNYIRGVGSGLPLVKEYLDVSHGSLVIEDNLCNGAVVTIYAEKHVPTSAQPDEEGEIDGVRAPAAAIVSSLQNQQPAMQKSHRGSSTEYDDAMKTRDSGTLQDDKAGEEDVEGAFPSSVQHAAYEAARVGMAVAPLSQRERDCLVLLLEENVLGVTELSKLTGIAVSSAYQTLKNLEESGLVERVANKKRTLTSFGENVALSLKSNA